MKRTAVVLGMLMLLGGCETTHEDLIARVIRQRSPTATTTVAAVAGKPPG